MQCDRTAEIRGEGGRGEEGGAEGREGGEEEDRSLSD